MQLPGGDVGSGAACDDAGELRFRRCETECLGEDRRWRTWPGAQGIQGQKSTQFLVRRMCRSLEGPNSHDHRVFVHARHNDRLENQGYQTGQAYQLIDGFLEERPGIRIANEKPPVLNLDVMVEN